ncbi:hypothetical protein NC652_004469 [Populus alba x Populus x berolinensis]|uniref:Uncharacterized protein n=1 Tax=Populus alba x Populus x berolinensis TaxID=444605 RepID=A0AAD6RU05_9ROSI|nr:hypothetical protein NC652_004469 [Populus alba x Populus x berolinensis]KAJ7015120.1 hypothetical protein NC653_004429 [Populus alba x Populus x berolinensis]
MLPNIFAKHVDILAVVWLNIVESSNQKSYKVWGERVWNYQTRESGDNGNFLGSWNSPK